MSDTGEKKPVNKIDKWWLMTEFIDNDGQVFKRGKFEGMADELGIKDWKPTEEKKSDLEEEAEKTKELLEETVRQNKELIEILKQSVLKGSNNDIVKLLNEVQAKTSGHDLRYDTGEIDRDDILPDGQEVNYYANGIAYLIVDYYNEVGKAVKSPYGRIFLFKLLGSRIIKNQRDESFNAFCGIKIKSKKEVEWLEKHPMFGLQFFRKSNQAKETNAALAAQAINIYNKLSTWDRTSILAEASNEGIDFDPTLGIDNVIKQLTQVKALRSYQEEIDEQKKKHGQNSVEALINMGK